MCVCGGVGGGVRVSGTDGIENYVCQDLVTRGQAGWTLYHEAGYVVSPLSAFVRVSAFVGIVEFCSDLLYRQGQGRRVSVRACVRACEKVGWWVGE